MNGTTKTLKELARDGLTTDDRTPVESSISLAKEVHMEKNNKRWAGDSRKETVKRSALSMEYKSKSFAASFRKSADDEDDVDYDYGNTSSDSSLSRIPEGTKTTPRDPKKAPLKTLTTGEDVSSDSAVDGSNKNMDCLKNTGAKASTKAAEISAKTSWMKDRVYNFWSKKGKQEEMDKDLNKTENETGIAENVGEVQGEEKTPVKKSPSRHESVKSQVEEHGEHIPAVEFKEGSKEKKQTRGWIRDQVSSLISKGKNYASSGASTAEVGSEEMKSIEMKNPESLSQKLSEHYSLKQTCDGNDEEAQIKFDDIPKIEEPKVEKEKFSDIHQNINRKISQQTAVVLTKEELSTPQVEEVLTSPKGTPKGGGSKKTSAKSKIKGFLNSRPLATELTHLPLASSNEKEERERNSLSAQTKKKFKFATKLSFSELLHSQEHGTQPSPEDDSQNSNAASPVFSKIEEPLSEDEDDLKKIVMPEDGSPYHSMKQKESSVTFVKIWSLAVLFYALYIIPISAFFSGLILGALVMYLVGCLVIWLFCPSGKSIEQYKEELKHYLKEQDSSAIKKSIRSVDPNTLKKPRDLKVCLKFIFYIVLFLAF